MDALWRQGNNVDHIENYSASPTKLWPLCTNKSRFTADEPGNLTQWSHQVRHRLLSVHTLSRQINCGDGHAAVGAFLMLTPRASSGDFWGFRR